MMTRSIPELTAAAVLTALVLSGCAMEVDSQEAGYDDADQREVASLAEPLSVNTTSVDITKTSDYRAWDGVYVYHYLYQNDGQTQVSIVNWNEATLNIKSITFSLTCRSTKVPTRQYTFDTTRTNVTVAPNGYSVKFSANCSLYERAVASTATIRTNFID